MSIYIFQISKFYIDDKIKVKIGKMFVPVIESRIK